MDDRRRSAKRVTEFIGGWADIVEAQPNPNQVGMFGAAPETKEDLIERWITSDAKQNTAPALF